MPVATWRQYVAEDGKLTSAPPLGQNRVVYLDHGAPPQGNRVHSGICNSADARRAALAAPLILLNFLGSFCQLPESVRVSVAPSAMVVLQCARRYGDRLPAAISTFYSLSFGFLQ
jgi:hypothetical protein